VLAEDAPADRDYPPLDRSMRDGFAVRSLDLPGAFRVIGEVRAGTRFSGTVGRGEAVEIMTGAPVPAGADAVVMVENAVRNCDRSLSIGEALASGANISVAGCEARAGQAPLTAGTRLDYTSIAWLAATGHATVAVYKKPRVAILPTGDEIVPVEDQPAPHQIRNSNAYSLAAQVTRAGGEPILLPVAPDDLDSTRKLIEQGLEADLLLLSGGVSAGKYDVVEPAFAQLGAEFFFDRVLIQPGAPAVFGRTRHKFFFGLPGNPASTMVVFEVLARAALELISGATEAFLPLTLARLTRPFRHKGALTRFLPAFVSCTEVTPVDSKGSGDVASLSRANAFLVADAQKLEYAVGEAIPVLLK
jgi:molybdopterin molybdotransferase